jgi:oligoendopeptidase F
LLDALYAIVTGCMEDEFQQRVYANPGMTLEQMNRLYAQLATAYGMEEVYGFSGMEWVLIPHSFQSPMYYISYAVSMVAALQLWEEQQTSEAEAWEAYWGIMMRGSYSDFRSVLMDNGLSDPLSETTIKRIAALIDRSIP